MQYRRYLTMTTLAAVAGASLFAGFAGTASAETPPYEGPPIIINPGPGPDPEPEPEWEIVLPEDDDDPEPPFDFPDEITDVPDCTHGCQPELPDDVVNPEGDDDPEPPFDFPDDITDDPCNHLTHGCGEDEPNDDLTSDPGCFDDAGAPVACEDDEPECEDDLVAQLCVDDEPECEANCDKDPGDEPGDEPNGGPLPRTGAGIAAMATAGLGLVGGGTALRLAALRRRRQQ